MAVLIYDADGNQHDVSEMSQADIDVELVRLGTCTVVRTGWQSRELESGVTIWEPPGVSSDG